MRACVPFARCSQAVPSYKKNSRVGIVRRAVSGRLGPIWGSRAAQAKGGDIPTM